MCMATGQQQELWNVARLAALSVPRLQLIQPRPSLASLLQGVTEWTPVAKPWIYE